MTTISPSVDIIKKISQNMKVMWLESPAQMDKSPWKKLQGKIKAGKSVDVEKILDEKGIYDAEQYF